MRVLSETAERRVKSGCQTQVYTHFVENESFKRFAGDMVYAITNP